MTCHCKDCGGWFDPLEMWEDDQCQMCWEAECDASWWRAVMTEVAQSESFTPAHIAAGCSTPEAPGSISVPSALTFAHRAGTGAASRLAIQRGDCRVDDKPAVTDGLYRCDRWEAQ